MVHRIDAPRPTGPDRVDLIQDPATELLNRLGQNPDLSDENAAILFPREEVRAAIIPLLRALSSETDGALRAGFMEELSETITELDKATPDDIEDGHYATNRFFVEDPRQ